MGRPVEIDLPTFDELDDPGDDRCNADLYAWRVMVEWTWERVLAMAVRDGAEAVHLHPWRLNHALTNKVGGAHYTLVPPRGDTLPALLRSARRLVAPNPVAGALGWWLQGKACGRARVTFRGQASEWLGVCWRGAGLRGADFYRLDYTPTPEPQSAAEPGAAADRAGDGG